MKKIICLLIISCALLASCKEKDKYTDTDIVVYSLYDNSSFSINLPIIDALDGNNTANFFYCDLTIDEIASKNTYYEKSDYFVRYFSSNNYYYLEFVDNNDNKNKYKLISECTVLVLDNDSLKIPYPRNYSLGLDGSEEYSDDEFTYLTNYYEKIGITKTDDSFHLINYKSVKGVSYDVTLTKTNGLTIVKSNN